MSTSPYAAAGPRLVDMGYSAIPILPGTKRPGVYSRGRYFGELDWQRFGFRLPTQHEVDIWTKWPDAGVCVCLGKASGGLVAVDIDTDNTAVQNAIQSVLDNLEPSPVQKSGRTGWTSFYRANPCVESTSFNISGGRALDLLAQGRQTVLPPTPHASTGQPYRWDTEWTLEQLSPDRLPLLPDDIADRFGAVLSSFGYYAPVARPLADSDGGIFREINDIALQRLDDWVPHLGIDAKRGANGNWRGVATWRGGENRNVSFDQNGIRDFAAGVGMTAIDVVIESQRSDFATAEKWLREKLGFREPPPVVFRSKIPAQPVVVQDPADVPVGAPIPLVDPFDPKEAGGLLQATAEWIYSISIKPSRELSMLSALGVMAAFAGRRYVGPTGLTAGLYLCGVAGTGVGKDAPLNAAKNLLTACGGAIANMLGPDDMSSDAVMETLLRTKPSCLATIDEIGSWFEESSRRGAQSFAVSRRKALLKLYSLSRNDQIWQGKDRASTEKLSSSEPVHSPCLSLLGMSTEEMFFKGLTEENLLDGFTARLTVVHVTNAPKRQRIGHDSSPPKRLVTAYRDALDDWPAGSLDKTNFKNPLIKPKMVLVPWDNDDVMLRYERYEQWSDDVQKEKDTSKAYISRAAEQVLKIAMIRAISRDAIKPRLTDADWQFGQDFLTVSIGMMEVAIDRHMSGSEFEDLYKRMLEYCRKAGDKGIKPSDLRRRPGMSKIKPRDWDVAIQFLTNGNRWEVRNTGKKGCRYYTMEGREVVEED